jgi:hypothetical protein
VPSHRRLDEGLSLALQHAHDEIQTLKPGVAVDRRSWVHLHRGSAAAVSRWCVSDYEWQKMIERGCRTSRTVARLRPVLHDDPRDCPTSIFGGRTIHTRRFYFCCR